MFGLKRHYKTKHLKLLNAIPQPSILDIWTCLSWVMIQRFDTCQEGQKRLTTLKYVCFLFKARLQLQKWIELSRTNILKQIYYEVRYGSVEVLQWISAYWNLFQVNYSEVWDWQTVSACFNLLLYDPFQMSNGHKEDTFN